MIIKKRTTPIDIAKLEAAIPRLPTSYRNRLEKQLVIRHKGYNGELKVDRYTEALLAHNFTILHDVYLYIKGSSFQIDTLIIGPHCIFVVEIKDFSGTILFNFTTNQFTRIFNDSETSFRNPVIQATTNKHQLTQWLEAHSFTNIPVFPLVAIADPGTILKIFPEDFDISNIVMHGEYLPHRIMKINEELRNEKTLLHQKIGALILKKCEAFNANFIIESGIDPRHLQWGVQCLTCMKFGMTRKHSGWNCTNCSSTSKDAHLRTINDFLLIVKPTITNKEARKLLMLTSRSTATRILKASNLTYDKFLKHWVRKNNLKRALNTNT